MSSSAEMYLDGVRKSVYYEMRFAGKCLSDVYLLLYQYVSVSINDIGSVLLIYFIDDKTAVSLVVKLSIRNTNLVLPENMSVIAELSMQGYYILLQIPLHSSILFRNGYALHKLLPKQEVYSHISGSLNSGSQFHWLSKTSRWRLFPFG